MAITFESNRSGCLTVDHDPQVALGSGCAVGIGRDSVLTNEVRLCYLKAQRQESLRRWRRDPSALKVMPKTATCPFGKRACGLMA